MPSETCYLDIVELRRRMDAYEQQQAEILSGQREILVKLDVFSAERNWLTGAFWALSRIGAAIVTLFVLVGWIAVNGIPGWLRKLFG